MDSSIFLIAGPSQPVRKIKNLANKTLIYICVTAKHQAQK